LFADQTLSLTVLIRSPEPLTEFQMEESELETLHQPDELLFPSTSLLSPYVSGSSCNLLGITDMCVPPENLFDSEDDIDSGMDEKLSTSLLDNNLKSYHTGTTFIRDEKWAESQQHQREKDENLESQVLEIPKGWTRKVITTSQLPGYQKIFYYNTNGKKFSSVNEIQHYFSRLGKTVKVNFQHLGIIHILNHYTFDFRMVFLTLILTLAVSHNSKV